MEKFFQKDRTQYAGENQIILSQRHKARKEKEK
jgi:hypothetical protein